MPDGPLLTALNAARAMLRDCYWWRRLADETVPWEQAVAESHIHFDGLPPPSSKADHTLAELNNYRPFALMWTEQAAGLRLRNDTAGYCCVKPSGIIIVQIELLVPEGIAQFPTQVCQDVSKKLGRIMQTGDSNQPGLFELSGLAGYLPLIEIQLFGYVRADAKAARDIGDVVVAELQLNWGLE